MNSILRQIFSLVLLLGSLAAVIPIARQAFRRSERDDPTTAGRIRRGQGDFSGVNLASCQYE